MSLVPAFDFSQNPQQLQALENLRPKKKSLQTPLSRLNEFLEPLNFCGQLCEWGTPHGSISRLLPAMVARALNKECLWVCDQDHSQLYPRSWAGLGFDLNNIYFVNEEKPLQSLRTLIQENSFSLIIVDSRQFLNKADMHFLAQSTREYGTSIFLFRSFFLSNKNGNPFCRYRINSTYSIPRKNFELSLIKGSSKKQLKLSFDEVLCG